MINLWDVGAVPIKILKPFTQKLRDCISNTFEIGKIPDCLKMTNVTFEHKNNEPTDKENWKNLPLMFKTFN